MEMFEIVNSNGEGYEKFGWEILLKDEKEYESLLRRFVVFQMFMEKGNIRPDIDVKTLEVSAKFLNSFVLGFSRNENGEYTNTFLPSECPVFVVALFSMMGVLDSMHESLMQMGDYMHAVDMVLGENENSI